MKHEYCQLQQAHWPTHMSTCAQNQSNQDDEGANDQNEAAAGHEAVQHFLSSSSNSAANPRSNGLGSQPSRSLQQVIFFFMIGQIEIHLLHLFRIRL